MSRQKILRRCVLLTAVFLFFAKTGFVSNAKVIQTAEGDGTATISWNDATNTDYSIGYAKVTDSTTTAKTEAQAMADKRSLVVNASTKSYTLTGLDNDAQYLVLINYTEKGYNKNYSYTSYNSYVYTKMTPVKNVAQDKWYKYIHQVNVKWDDKPGSVSYEIKFMNSKGKVIEKKDVGYSNSYSHTIKNNIIYKIQVRAARKAYDSYSTVGTTYSDWSDAQYLFTQPTVTSAKVQNGRMKIKWGKISGATSYTIYASTNQTKGYKKIKTVKGSKNGFTIKKLKGKKFKKGKTYYIYVTANKKVGKKLIKKDVTYTYICKNNGKPNEGYK